MRAGSDFRLGELHEEAVRVDGEAGENRGGEDRFGEDRGSGSR